jgi:hypothetical protein
LSTDLPAQARKKHLECKFCGTTGKMRLGMCGLHYQRLRKHGDPHMTLDGRPAAFVREMLNMDVPDCLDQWPFGFVSGYPQLRWEGQQSRGHRLVCQFKHGPAPSAGHHAAHSCGNRACLNWRHIRWATARENMADKWRHGTMACGERQGLAKLTADQVLSIRSSWEQGATILSLAREYGVCTSTLGSVVHRVTWAHV